MTRRRDDRGPAAAPGARLLGRRELLAMTVAAGAAPAFPAARAPRPGEGGAPLESQPIAFFSKHLQFLDYPALAETVAEAGFDAVDLTVRPGGHVSPERVEEQLPRAVEAARAAGLEVPMMTTAITSADDDHATTVLRTAASVGIRHYRMGYVRYDEAAGVTGTIDALVPRWRELAALNRSLGIRAGYQNHAGDNVGAAVWDLWQVLDRVRSPWLGCQYDVRHAVAEGAYSWVRGLQLIAPFVHTLVVKDFIWAELEGRWRIENVPVGEGIVDFRGWARQLRGAGVAAPITVHFEYLEPDDSAPIAERRKRVLSATRADLQRLRSLLAADAAPG